MSLLTDVYHVVLLLFIVNLLGDICIFSKAVDIWISGYMKFLETYNKMHSNVTRIPLFSRINMVLWSKVPNNLTVAKYLMLHNTLRDYKIVPRFVCLYSLIFIALNACCGVVVLLNDQLVNTILSLEWTFFFTSFA